MIRSRVMALFAVATVAGPLAAVVPAAQAVAGPPTAPPARVAMGMTYDAARGEAVLFGGRDNLGGFLGDTWTWVGTGWTPRTPPDAPSARELMGMAYDAAHGQVELFGGDNAGGFLGDTWTWEVVLFGGVAKRSVLGDTWTWVGTDWTLRAPKHDPSARVLMGMAYDTARGQVVLFGGVAKRSVLGDTWSWDGTDWAIPFQASIELIPSSGPPGTVVTVEGSGFGGIEQVRLTFRDSVIGTTKLGVVTTDGTGAFTSQVTIPLNATPGNQYVKAKGHGSGHFQKSVFTVT